MHNLMLMILLAQPQAPPPPQAPPIDPPKVHRVTLKDGWTYRFDATWTEAEIREWISRKEASRPADDC